MTSVLLVPAWRKQLGKMARISMLREGAASYRQCCVVFPVQGSGLEKGGRGGGGAFMMFVQCLFKYELWS